MKQSAYAKLVGSIFALLALFHIYRLVVGLPMDVGGWSIPNSMSILGLVLSAGLSWLGFKSKP
ncbi:hypothetical protein G7069_07805 [Lysobacter sp. HDW10]|uniref:hypothetical protein n=1 Tax=Lysobacter sp. HDW10 TaxID=2714936 RepID=UPI00140C6DFD|nr:hypothetical protein [Lysobacter sp. HDW10]QIK81505.1 hypothetical protein G7069_07805 [Lysobacter sp. HDW10]